MNNRSKRAPSTWARAKQLMLAGLRGDPQAILLLLASTPASERTAVAAHAINGMAEVLRSAGPDAVKRLTAAVQGLPDNPQQ